MHESRLNLAINDWPPLPSKKKWRFFFPAGKENEAVPLTVLALERPPVHGGVYDGDVGDGDGEGGAHDGQVHRVEPVAPVQEDAGLEGERAEGDLQHEVAGDYLAKKK